MVSYVKNHKYEWTALTEGIREEFIADGTFEISFEEHVEFSGE